MSELSYVEPRYYLSSDVIEIKIMDNNYNTYFKKKAHLRSKPEMKLLFEELKQKGVDIPMNFMEWIS